MKGKVPTNSKGFTEDTNQDNNDIARDDILKSVTEEEISQQDEFKSNLTSQVITVNSDMSSLSDQDIPQMPFNTSG